MTLEIVNVQAAGDQTPTVIRFSYRDSGNSIVTATYSRGTTWPAEAETGGDTFPFQSAKLDNTRNALIVYMNRLPAFINGLTNNGGMKRNNSLYIFPGTTNAAVAIPSVPSLETDMAVSMRNGSDLTAYTAGFSLVSQYRLYVADSLNEVPTSIPANSGIPAGTAHYPPLSIFAPEKRFGESMNIQNGVELRGQLSSLKTGATDTYNPLELFDSRDVRVAASQIDAELSTLISPAQLPPVHMMNWLVTIEEIQ